ncbi:hypothetical protein [Bradyrhizobium sp. CCBAU 53421]|uniref:hypothetical protein n=1 Tax=Bradyrhizobium sp. CCBAU 53421 TaxID=1325120 RepID=UPI00188CA83A|nr:hypothetical protein [Bradyrhizobium sp. CCBAU 53421]QOZ34660.1 hypothetical protein XH92_25815 [Bradyrhizobium sp. CCBAU 53421]
MQKMLTSLSALVHLIAGVGFAIAGLAAVIAATVVVFGFAGEPELVASVLILGFVTALAEAKL